MFFFRNEYLANTAGSSTNLYLDIWIDGELQVQCHEERRSKCQKRPKRNWRGEHRAVANIARVLVLVKKNTATLKMKMKNYHIHELLRNFSLSCTWVALLRALQMMIWQLATVSWIFSALKAVLWQHACVDLVEKVLVNVLFMYHCMHVHVWVCMCVCITYAPAHACAW